MIAAQPQNYRPMKIAVSQQIVFSFTNVKNLLGGIRWKMAVTPWGGRAIENLVLVTVRSSRWWPEEHGLIGG